MSDALDLQWRPMREDDRNFVLSSWLRSYASSLEFRGLSRGVYFELYAPVVERLLERSTILVAWTPDLPDTVIGWLACEGDDVVHYILVKSRFRRLGVGRWMTQELSQVAAVYTHQPSAAGARLVGGLWQYEPMRRFDRQAA